MLPIWNFITNLGAASVLAPLIPLLAVCLWRAREHNAALVWFTTLSTAVFLTLATKVAFMGWGIGIQAIDFTGVSGHTLLATSVLPVLFGWLIKSKGLKIMWAGALAGCGIAALVGTSRMALDAHSVSEVVAGWLLGLFVSLPTLFAMNRQAVIPRYGFALPLVLLLALHPRTSEYLPSHGFEVQLATYLSGRDAPFTRPSL